MKFLITSALILCFVMSSSEALKDEVCGEPHSQDGYLDGNGILMFCDDNVPRFSYDSENKKCVNFFYRGCGGNDNRFLTERECKEKCVE